MKVPDFYGVRGEGTYQNGSRAVRGSIRKRNRRTKGQERKHKEGSSNAARTGMKVAWEKQHEEQCWVSSKCYISSVATCKLTCMMEVLTSVPPDLGHPVAAAPSSTLCSFLYCKLCHSVSVSRAPAAISAGV